MVVVKNSITFHIICICLIILTSYSEKQLVADVKGPVAGEDQPNGSNQQVKYAYIVGGQFLSSDGTEGLRVIDISDPKNPFEVGFCHTPIKATGIYVSGRYAYVNADTLRVIDVSNPSKPVEVGSYKTPGGRAKAGLYGVHVVGQYAYVADADAGLRVIDISDPANPKEVGFCDRPGEVRWVFVSGQYAYVADSILAIYNDGPGGGLRVIDISDPRNPRAVARRATVALSVHVSGNYACVTNINDGIAVIDVSIPRNPKVMGSFDTEYAWGVYVSGHYAYVADQKGLLVIDISDPKNLREVGSIDTHGAYQIQVLGGYAYVVSDGLHIVDVSDPANPREIGFCKTSGPVLAVYVPR